MELTFDARFSCKRRHYKYVIFNRKAPVAIDKNRVWWLPRQLDAEKMHEAAQTILGHHDFTTFRASECQAKTAMRTLDMLNVRREGETIIIESNARSYLHHQVRSISGSLMEVGVGMHETSWLKQILEAKDRQQCGEVAPACGLYFMKADY